MVKADTEEEVKEYYNNRYRKEHERAMRPYIAYKKLLKYLKLKKGKKLLDVGCGTGQFLKAAIRNGITGYGIDFSKQAIEIAKQISPEAKILHGRAEKIPFPDKSFDYLVSLGCLQYLPDMEKAIKEMKRVAKNNCEFLFMMPNSNFLLWKIKGKNPKVLWGIEKNILSLKKWVDFLEKNGFVVKTYRDLWFYQKYKIFDDKNPTKIIIRLFIKIVWYMLPSPISYQHIFHCRLSLNHKN